MSTPDGPSAPATAGTDDLERDLEAAARAFESTRKHGTAAAPPTLLEFASQLQFLLTIGYLTKDQAQALLAWFKSSGTVRPPKLAGPDGVAAPTMYEILTTAIHFGTPREVLDLEGIDLAGADILDFFAGVAQAVGDLVTTVADAVTEVLEAGTGLVQAATGLVHEIHELVVEAA